MSSWLGVSVGRTLWYPVLQGMSFLCFPIHVPYWWNTLFFPYKMVSCPREIGISSEQIWKLCLYGTSLILQRAVLLSQLCVVLLNIWVWHSFFSSLLRFLAVDGDISFCFLKLWMAEFTVLTCRWLALHSVFHVMIYLPIGYLLCSYSSLCLVRYQLLVWQDHPFCKNIYSRFIRFIRIFIISLLTDSCK